MRLRFHTLSVLAAAAAISLPCHAAVELLVPAYFYPSFDPALSQWDEMTAAAQAGASITAIMNPDSGVGAGFNADYAAAVNAFRAAGGRVLGYVYTCYGGTRCFDGLPPTRSVGEVLDQAQRYADWYGVDGIFLDEMSNLAADLGFYADISTALRTARPGWRLIGNPGTSAPESYLSVVDTIVTFEGGAGYGGSAGEPWMSTADPSRQAHLHYNVADADAMRLLLDQAVARRARMVYFTDDRYVPGDPTAPNPWDRLPTYWSAEVSAVNAVPEPHPLALLTAGLVALAWRRRSARP